MMKTVLIKKVITMSSICCLLFSCGKWRNSENSALMQQAQQLLELMPDSALTLLDAANAASFSNAEKAEYHLLRVQAKDKAGQNITADTVIFTARDYFVAAKNDEKAALACYYAGRVRQEQGKANAAMQEYLEAERMVNELKNHERLKGLIAFYTGNLFYKRIEPTEAIEHYRKAAKHFRWAGENVNEMYTWNAIGTSHLSNELFDSALYYFNKVTEMPAYREHQIMQASVMRNIGIISRYEDDYQKARDLFMQALRQTTDEQTKAYLYICLSQAYQGLRRVDSATFYIERAMKLCEQMPNPPMASIYETLIQMEENKGNYKEALRYAQKQYDYAQNTYTKNLEQQLSEAERKFNYEAKQNKINQLTIKRKNDRILFLNIFVGCLVVVVALFTISIRRKKTIIEKNTTIDLLTQQIDEHSQQVVFLKEEIERNQEIIRQLENEKISGTNKNHSAIDAKIKVREEHVGNLENQLRISYAYKLKTHLEIMPVRSFNQISPI